jgi:hypothetical protein
MASDIDRLIDRATTPYRTVHADATVRDAAVLADAEWIVVTSDAGAPVACVSRSALAQEDPGRTMLAAARAAPPPIVADADTPLDRLLGAPAFRDTAADAVVALAGGAVVGVWAGLDLATELVEHASRFASDWGLPGAIGIPAIVRICQHAVGVRTCTASLSFPERPSRMPPCPDPVGLGPHTFAW